MQACCQSHLEHCDAHMGCLRVTPELGLRCSAWQRRYRICAKRVHLRWWRRRWLVLLGGNEPWEWDIGQIWQILADLAKHAEPSERAWAFWFWGGPRNIPRPSGQERGGGISWERSSPPQSSWADGLMDGQELLTCRRTMTNNN